MGNQTQPAQDESAHEDLTELAIGLHQRQYAFVVQFNHFAGLAGADSSHGPPPGDHVDFAGELSRAYSVDKGFLGARRTNDLKFAGGHHKKWEDLISLFDQHLAAFSA